MGVTHPRPDGPAGRRNWTFVRIETDEGITGIGEATTEWYEHAVVAMIEQQFAPILIGQDPTKINRAWQEMRRRFWWRDGVASTSAISGIDQALWDILGKSVGLPVYKLLGGAVRDKIELYARPDLGTPTDVGELEAAMSEGFGAYKHGVGTYISPYDENKQIDVTIDLYQRLRKTARPDVKLMMDCLGNWSMQAAHRIIDALSDQNILFFEEPVNVDNPRQLVELRRAFPGQRIAAGERLYTRWDVREWLELGAVDVLQVDICHTGGISEMMRIAAAAEVYNVTIAPHNPYGPVALAANIHACAAMQNFLILEHWRDHDLFDKVQVHGPTVVDGCAILDDKPGLGVELDWEFIKKYPYCELTQFHFNDRFGGMASI